MSTVELYNFESARKDFSKCIENTVKVEKKEDLLTFVQQYEGSDAEKKATLDQAFKDALKELVAVQRNCAKFKTVINLSAYAVTQDLCSSFTPFHLLSDLFDMVTLDVCEATFDLVEDNVYLWKSDMFFEAGKNYLLRMCNDLLRRLSKAHNTVFCGRIQLFLARLFPLSEKSALNLTSQFNLENVTVYLSEPEELKPKGSDKNESMEGIEEGEMSDLSFSSDPCPIDYNLYRKFWYLQDIFRKPTQCYEKAPWKKFSSVSTCGLWGPISATHPLSELFDLQLSDSNFRRYVLVQFLILFQYLHLPVRFKSSSFVLTEEQNQWVDSTQEKVYRLIKETPPDGDKFVQAIKHILKREENWNSWKNEGCPSFERSKGDSSQTKQKLSRKSVGDDLQATGGKIIKMGNAELTRLWNLSPGNMAACKSDKRVFLPSVEEFFAEPIEQADPENMIEDEYKLVNNINFQWRALRLLARRSPHFFTHTNQPAMALPAYLELMVTKLAKEMPPAEEVKTQIEDEEELKDTPDEVDNLKHTDTSPAEVVEKLSAQQIQLVSDKIDSDWKKLATELNFLDDEILYFESETTEVSAQAIKMLTKWQENEGERATPGALKIALREIGLAEIAETIFKNITE
ncbi:THO complex subunit 1-like [Liolophura sinensis]|uniref:THO complex subunit 1-like n=1 Tax=Liolophura sinensis TaxID=3198878 RepID=UPI00315814D2